MENNQILDYESTQSESTLVDAPLSKRFFNSLIDRLAILGIVFTLAAIGDLVAKESIYIIILPVIILYYPLMEGIWGQTIGKMITQTRVVDGEGNKINFLTACFRSICRIIPFEQFSFFFNDNKRGWHDTITGTRVVEK